MKKTIYEEYKALLQSIPDAEKTEVEKFIVTSKDFELMKKVADKTKSDELAGMKTTIKLIESAKTFHGLLNATYKFAFEDQNVVKQKLRHFTFFVGDQLKIDEGSFSRYEDNFRNAVLAKMKELGYGQSAPTIKKR